MWALILCSSGIWMGGGMDRRMNDGWTDGWMNEWMMDGCWMDKWMDGWMNAVVRAWTCLPTCLNIEHRLVSLQNQASPFLDQRDPAGKVLWLSAFLPVSELRIWMECEALGEEIVFLILLFKLLFWMWLPVSSTSDRPWVWVDLPGSAALGL